MRMVVAICAAWALAGCDDSGKAQREKAEGEKAQQAARAERYKAEREAENKAMSDSITVEATIHKRLTDWLTVQDRMFVFKGYQTSVRNKVFRSDPWFAMPSDIPWFISCDSSGLHVTLGAWSEVSGSSENVSASSTFSFELSNARLTEEQCKTLVVVAGSKMRAIASR